MLGASFNTPEAILVRSNDGIGGMSRVMHRLMLDKLIAPLPTWAECQAPILLNTWEANYFDVNHSSVIDMTQQVH